MAFDGTLKFDTAIDKSGFKAGIDSLGSIAEAGMKVVKGLALTTTAAVTAAGAAIGALTKSAIEGYADYEQLVGGVETLFGAGGQSLEDYAASVGKTVDGVRAEYEMLSAAQEEVLANADNAFRTAGMSANDYMETVTSFSAALIQSLGGDTLAAAQKADMAITDMADNINKMGSDAESVENAYKGFAKQNFTMLDNLKLGYGGTKEEMQRLLADAEKISGVKYDISSYADIVDAIHVVQTEMGITGTTAREAASTIQGSMSMASAAWDNFITGMADPESDFDALLGNLIDSIVIVGDNLIPRITATVPRLVEGVSELISELAGYIPDIVQELLPAFMEGAEELVSAVTDILPQLLSIVGELVPQLVDSVTTLLPEFAEAGVQVVTGLCDGIVSNIGSISTAALKISGTLVDAFIQLAPKLLDAAAKAVITLAKGITDNVPLIKDAVSELILEMTAVRAEVLPELIDAVTQVIAALVEIISDNSGLLIDSALQIISVLAESLISNIGVLVDAAVELVFALSEYIVGNADKMSEAAVELVLEVCAVLIENAPKLLAAAVILFGALVDALVTLLGELLETLYGGLSELGDVLAEGAEKAVKAVVEWFTQLTADIEDALISGVSGISDAADRIWQSIKDVFSGVGGSC